VTLLTFDERPSDSPFIERVWRSRSASAGSFLSIASTHCEMVVTRCRGEVFLTVRGPEKRATVAQCPSDGEWIGVRLRLGTFMPHLLPCDLSDRRDVTLPGAASESFWLRGSAWEYPTYSNAETFVMRLARQGVIVRNPIVDRMRRFSTRRTRPDILTRRISRGRSGTSSARRLARSFRPPSSCRFYTKQRLAPSRMMRSR